MKTVALFAFAGLAASAAMGQTITITPGGAGTGSTNGWYQYTPPTSATGSLSSTGQALNRAGFSTASPNDMIWVQGWGFRGNNDGREYAFASSSSTNASTVTTTAGLVGGTLAITRAAGFTGGSTAGTTASAQLNYSVVQNAASSAATPGYTFTSQQTFTITTDPLGPRVVMQNTVTNTGTAPMTLRLYWAADTDVGGSGDSTNDFTRYQGGVGAPLGQPGFYQFDNSTSPTNLGQHMVHWAQVTGSPSSVVDLNWLARAGTSNVQSELFGSNVLISGGLFNNTPALNGATLPGGVAGAEITWGFQWILNLQPGESAIATVGTYVVPTPGALALMGMGGLIAARRRRA
jgi:hypothetical protein